ncbi:MAG: Ldh family oxidoreductase [Nitrososphaeria archaeon]
MIQLFQPEELERFGTEVFQKLGFDEKNSRLISSSLVLANLRGVDSHGVVRIPVYADGVTSGQINPKPRIRVLKETDFFCLIDGDNTLGYIPATLATEIAISKAKTFGIGLAAVKNLKHSGMLAKYTMQIVKERLFGLATANASPNVALLGFKRPVVGTNPLSLGFPTESAPPIILDMAMSVVARGKVLVASKKGVEIPKGWAINEKGEETTDAEEAIKGMMLPIGGHKGFGLALMIDILCGIVVGGGYGLRIERSWYSQGGFLVLASRLDLARSYDDYATEIREYVRQVKATPVIEGVKVLLPNEIEHELTLERSRKGVPVEDDICDEFLKLSKRYNVEPPKGFPQKT